MIRRGGRPPEYLETSMPNETYDRRDFVKTALGSAAAVAAFPAGASALGLSASAGFPQSATRGDAGQAGAQQSKTPVLKFAVVGINHAHIYAQVNAVLRGGGGLEWVYAREPDLLEAFRKQFPQAKAARSEAEVLEDPSVKLVLSSGIPEDRAPLGVRVMRHGKDYMADKPGITTLEQLAEVRKVQAETKRIYSIMYSERFENPATVKAGELVKAGAIGRVLQTIGLGPHRMTPASRPPWFFERPRYGGILCDIGSHQGDQFLFFTGSTKAEVVASQIGNLAHPQYPGLEDFGDVMLKGDGGTGYIRVDWFTPDGLATWGDGRLTILGTEGFIEIRKNIDIAGRPGGSHLFLVTQKETRYIDCSTVQLPYGSQLVSDVLNRTETAMPQVHCFLATEIMLQAQKNARRLEPKK
jgi:predicted dehydrogenase